MPTYKLSTEGVDEIIEADNEAEMEELAEEWLREIVDPFLAPGWQGDPEELETYWEDVTWVEVGNENNEGVITARIDPPEPDCADDESHNWTSPHEIVGGIEENPGVWGHGGGVIIHEACSHCGCRKTTDTWAQRSDTGEQGLESITYEPGCYAHEEEVD